MRILFLTEDERGPSTRYRVLQFLPRLESRGIEVETAAIPGGRRERRRLFESAAGFDRVVLQRRLVHPFDFRVLRKNARDLTLDFDDAIVYPDSASGKKRSFTRWIRFLNVASSVDRVVVGNAYLAELMTRYHRRIAILPTVVDLAKYPDPDLDSLGVRPATAVWIGSRSTLGYLEAILPWMDAARKDVADLSVRVIADAVPRPGSVPVEGVAFGEETEARDLSVAAVGLAPLPDDRWTRGKCGLKLLQYMAAGVPAVASPVGVQGEMVTHGATGLHASTPEEWTRSVVGLLNDRELAAGLARAARQRVERDFSLDAWAERWMEEMAGPSATQVSGDEE